MYYEGEPLSTACCFDTGCSKLKEIHLGKNVETFGTSKNLPNLETITVTPGNQTFYVEDGVLYSKENEKNDESSNAVICYPAKKKGSSYRIPEGIADIAGGAFAWAKSLEQVHLPKGIRLIGNCAFSHSGLKEVVLPEGIQNISSAFADCSHLEKVTIPKISGDGHMGYAFKNCLRLKMVMMQNLPQYFACAFSGCSSLEELQLPENLKGIVQKEGVLFDSNLHTLLFYPAGKKDKSYQIPDGVERISDSAFAGTQHLSEVIINRELQIIEENAFMDAKIENIHLNDGLKKICWSAFEGSDILELRLPDNCEIPSSIFENCKKLRSVNLPSNMEILNCGFGGCSSLRSLHIPRKTRKFDGNFLNLKGCTSLSSITVERGSRYFTAVNGVLYIKSKKMLIAYPPAKKGEKFSVPKSVKKISYGAFVDSRFLQQVSMKDSVITCGMNAFSGGTALRTV